MSENNFYKPNLQNFLVTYTKVTPKTEIFPPESERLKKRQQKLQHFANVAHLFTCI